MPPGGPRTRARGKNYVLPLAIILVLGQIAAFVAIKLSKDKPAKPTVADNAIAQAPVQGSAGLVPDVTAPPTTNPTPDPTAPTAPTTNPTPDPTAPPTTDPTTTTTDTAGTGTTEPPPVADEPPVPVDPKQAKRDAAKAKAAKDKAEKLAKDKEDKAAKAEKERREAEDRQKAADAKRASEAEKARLAAETEKARLAAEKAKADAAAEEARLEAEKIKAAAAAKAAADAQAAANAGTGSGTGSSKVLVLVFGPGVSSASREAIRNVYLGKTSVWPNGTTAHPMNRPAGSAAGRKFFGGILGMSIGEYREHWSQLQLSGGGIAPSTVSSATTMLAKVAATKGGMGYVLESELPENTNGVTLVRLK